MSETIQSAGGLGEPTTVVGSLDMAKTADRMLLRRSVNDELNGRRRWGGITDAVKEHHAAALTLALDYAKAQNDPRAVASIVSTLAALEGQNQRDRHKAIDIALKSEEATNPTASGKTTIVVNILGLNDPVPPPPNVEIVATQ